MAARFCALALLGLVACSDSDGPSQPQPDAGNAVAGRGDLGQAAVGSSDTPRPAPRCGDGVTQDSEACDDGNNAGGDACSADCQQETDYCGDGVVQPPELCEPAADDSVYERYFGECSASCAPRSGIECGGAADEDAGADAAASGCTRVGESGIDPELDYTELDSSQIRTMCEWLNRVKTERPALTRCPTFNYERTQQDCSVEVQADPRLDLSCGISIFEIERCMREIDEHPCESLIVESPSSRRFRPDCFEAACEPSP